VILEDSGSKRAMNLWIGPSDGSGAKAAMSKCEAAVSLKGAVAIVNPAQGLEVDTTPLFTAAGGCSAVIHPNGGPTPAPAPTPPPPPSPPTPPPSPPTPGDTTMATLTFYGARDNCPPGGDIAHPTIHKLAGGTGNWADPITFAGADLKGQGVPYAVGQKVYVPSLQKYFIMEDQCEEVGLFPWALTIFCELGTDTCCALTTTL
jgi:hypothetical protein